MNTVESIKRRRSVRTFNSKHYSDETEKFIEDYLTLNKNEIGPFGNVVTLFKFEPKAGVKLGTYGIIKNPQAYIAGTCSNSNKGLIDFGYLFEKMIVDFNKKQIGTCWLGGTFKRESFEAMVVKGQDDIMPAVTPIGHFDDKRLFESLMRKATKADLRNEFANMFFKGDFKTGLDKNDANPFMLPLELVRMGPSASNKQPWRILINDNLEACHLYLEESPKYNNALSYPIQLLDMGIAMYHFEAGCKSLNISGSWTEKDPELKTPNDNYKYIVSYKL